MESTEWYKKKGDRVGENIDEQISKFKNKSWKSWRKYNRTKKEKSTTGGEEKREAPTEVQGVLFVQHTHMSELAKRLREKLKTLEEISLNCREDRRNY